MFRELRFIPLAVLALTVAACWNNKKSNSLDSADSATSDKTNNAEKKSPPITLVATEEELDVLLKKSTPLLILKCETTWCSACKDMEPFFLAAAQQLTEYTFARVNIDVVPTVAKNYDLVGVPTVLFIKDGKEISASRMVGVTVANAKDFIDKVQEAGANGSDQSITKQNSLVASLQAAKHTAETPASAV